MTRGRSELTDTDKVLMIQLDIIPLHEPPAHIRAQSVSARSQSQSQSWPTVWEAELSVGRPGQTWLGSEDQNSQGFPALPEPRSALVLLTSHHHQGPGEGGGVCPSNLGIYLEISLIINNERGSWSHTLLCWFKCRNIFTTRLETLYFVFFTKTNNF